MEKVLDRNQSVFACYFYRYDKMGMCMELKIFLIGIHLFNYQIVVECIYVSGHVQ